MLRFSLLLMLWMSGFASAQNLEVVAKTRFKIIGLTNPGVIAGDLVDEFEVPEQKASRLLQKQSIGLQIIRALNSQRVDATTVTPDWY